MTSGLVNASFSLPEWQAVEMIFFAPWVPAGCNRSSIGGRLLKINFTFSKWTTFSRYHTCTCNLLLTSIQYYSLISFLSVPRLPKHWWYHIFFSSVPPRDQQLGSSPQHHLQSCAKGPQISWLKFQGKCHTWCSLLEISQTLQGNNKCKMIIHVVCFGNYQQMSHFSNTTTEKYPPLINFL